jgi:hypothetical protein
MDEQTALHHQEAEEIHNQELMGHLQDLEEMHLLEAIINHHHKIHMDSNHHNKIHTVSSNLHQGMVSHCSVPTSNLKTFDINLKFINSHINLKHIKITKSKNQKTPRTFLNFLGIKQPPPTNYRGPPQQNQYGNQQYGTGKVAPPTPEMDAYQK